MSLFHRDINKKLAEHIKKLEKAKLLKDDWIWNPDKIENLDKIDISLLKDIIKLHREHKATPEFSKKAVRLLKDLHVDLKLALARKVEWGKEDEYASAINHLISEISSLIGKKIKQKEAAPVFTPSDLLIGIASTKDKRRVLAFVEKVRALFKDDTTFVSHMVAYGAVSNEWSYRGRLPPPFKRIILSGFLRSPIAQAAKSLRMRIAQAGDTMGAVAFCFNELYTSSVVYPTFIFPISRVLKQNKVLVNKPQYPDRTELRLFPEKFVERVPLRHNISFIETLFSELQLHWKLLIKYKRFYWLDPKFNAIGMIAYCKDYYEALEDNYSVLKRINDKREIKKALLEFKLRTKIPKKGLPSHHEIICFIGLNIFNLSKKEFVNLSFKEYLKVVKKTIGFFIEAHREFIESEPVEKFVTLPIRDSFVVVPYVNQEDQTWVIEMAKKLDLPVFLMNDKFDPNKQKIIYQIFKFCGITIFPTDKNSILGILQYIKFIKLDKNGNICYINREGRSKDLSALVPWKELKEAA